MSVCLSHYTYFTICVSVSQSIRPSVLWQSLSLSDSLTGSLTLSLSLSLPLFLLRFASYLVRQGFHQILVPYQGTRTFSVSQSVSYCLSSDLVDIISWLNLTCQHPQRFRCAWCVSLRVAAAQWSWSLIWYLGIRNLPLQYIHSHMHAYMQIYTHQHTNLTSLIYTHQNTNLTSNWHDSLRSEKGTDTRLKGFPFFCILLWQINCACHD